MTEENGKEEKLKTEQLWNLEQDVLNSWVVGL